MAVVFFDLALPLAVWFEKMPARFNEQAFMIFNQRHWNDSPSTHVGTVHGRAFECFPARYISVEILNL